MKNEWNLKLLFEGEEQWRETVVSLPEQADAIRAMLKGRIPGEAGEQSQKDTDAGAAKPVSRCGERTDTGAAKPVSRCGERTDTGAAKPVSRCGEKTDTGAAKPVSRCGERTDTGAAKPVSRYEDSAVSESLEKILRALESMITDSSHAEIWLSCMTTLHPVDPHYAALSDLLDRSELGELPLMKELQAYLRTIPDLEDVLASQPYLRELSDYCRHLKNRIIPLESPDGEAGGGWYRVNALMKEAFVEYHGDTVTWQELQGEDGNSDWGEEMHSCHEELHRMFYEKYGEQAAAILREELRRDEQDYRNEEADSLTIYLGEYGLSAETLEMMLLAVEEGLPDWHDCRRKLNAYHDWLEAEYAEEVYDGEEYAEEAGNEAAEEILTEQQIEEQNLAAYRTLRDTLLQQFGDFHPAFRAMVEESFAGKWVWINDDPLAFMDQHASMVPGTSHSYIALSADCYLPAAAHELGHAWANYCVKDQNILYNQNEILLELPANLAALWSYRWTIGHRYETIDRLEADGAPQDVLDYLRQRAESPLIYEEMLGETLTNIYDGYTAFLFERELRSRILSEKLTAEDISRMYLKYRRRIRQPEGQDRSLDPFRWVELHNLFTCRAYYNLPYILSMLIAWRILGEIDSGTMGQDEYRQRITNLLRMMNRRPAEEVLREFFGEDIRSMEFWRKCMAEVTALFRRISECIPESVQVLQGNSGK